MQVGHVFQPVTYEVSSGASSNEHVAREREDDRAVVASRLMKPTDQDGGGNLQLQELERDLAVADKMRARLRAAARGEELVVDLQISLRRE